MYKKCHILVGTFDLDQKHWLIITNWKFHLDKVLNQEVIKKKGGVEVQKIEEKDVEQREKSFLNKQNITIEQRKEPFAIDTLTHKL